jgi:protein-S-isoprenylcysteine O-methyltransferase Ste14
MMQGRPLALLTDTCFVVLALYFICTYIRFFNTYQQPQTIFFFIYQLLALTLLLIRKNAVVLSSRPIDYVYALVGLGSPLLFRPIAEYASSAMGMSLEVAGGFFVLGAFLSLNRSFGIAPENRGVKSMGFYRIIRHPMYFGYALAEMGFVINNFSYYNLTVFALVISFTLLRLQAEERVLRKDPAYPEYAKKVRWKLIPLIF